MEIEHECGVLRRQIMERFAPYLKPVDIDGPLDQDAVNMTALLKEVLIPFARRVRVETLRDFRDNVAWLRRGYLAYGPSAKEVLDDILKLVDELITTTEQEANQ